MNKLTAYSLIGIVSLTTGCALVEQAEKILLPDTSDIEKTVTEEKTLIISCGKGNIDDHLKENWSIVKSEELEVPCTWKTKKAKRGCNLELDKGCKITVPDKMGKEIRYSLERKSTTKQKQ